MFHGPCFQGVASLDSVGENGILAHLQVLPRTNLFRSGGIPTLLLDPVLLDAAAQPIGPWAVEHLDGGYVLFPLRLAALELYGPPPAVSERVRCETEIQQVTPFQLRATISLFNPDGQIIVRMVGWEDWRFFWSQELYDFCRLPKRYLLSLPWATPVKGLPQDGQCVCRRVDPTPEHTRAMTMRTLVHTLLSRTERQQWQNLKGRDIRRSEWLFGRAAAKDAVRQLMKERDGRAVFPADIEICQDADGRPFARLAGSDESAIMPSISIAHSDGRAVALAGWCAEGGRPGIDIERIRPRDEAFQEIAFSRDERVLLDAFPGPARDEWVARLWCAKEAAAKALGKGLAEGPRHCGSAAWIAQQAGWRSCSARGSRGRIPSWPWRRWPSTPPAKTTGRSRALSAKGVNAVHVSDDVILADLIGVIKGLTDWEYSETITRETRFFADLGFESIDAVVLGEAIEAHYRRRFPYAEFLASLGERNAKDLHVGELIDFLRPHLNDDAPHARVEGA